MAEVEPLVTIGMAMHDASTTVEVALRSILAQTWQNWELFILDDNSRDGSLDIVRAFDDPRIRVVADQTRRGLAVRMNQAIACGKGEFFARMDADDVSYPYRLERQVEFLSSHPDIDLVGASAIVFRGHGVPLGKREGPGTHDEITASPRSHFAIAHPTWLGRMSWFRRHTYDERAWRAQDQILLLSAYEHSRFANLPEILLGYREPRINVQKCFRGRWSFVRSYIGKVGMREPRGIAIAVTTHGFKLGVETFAAWSGLEHRVLRHRARPITVEESMDWATIWTTLTGTPHSSGETFES